MPKIYETDDLISSKPQKGMSLLKTPDEYVVIDLETTGLSPKWDSIIEFGALKVKEGRVTNTFSQLVNPQRRINAFITELTGITDDMVSSAPVICDVLPEFLDFTGSLVVVGHNVNFDLGFICSNCQSVLNTVFLNDFVDTMRLSRRLFPQYRRHRLCDLVERFDIGDSTAHRALSDAYQTNQCYLYMKDYMLKHGIRFE